MAGLLFAFERQWPHASGVYDQVTGASGFVGSHVVDELLRQGYSVRGYAYIHYSHRALLIVAVVAVRSHNVASVSKGYESFGDRFATTVIEDLTTSDLLQAVKGSCRLSNIYVQGLNMF